MTVSNIRIGLFFLVLVFLFLIFFYWKNEELNEQKAVQVENVGIILAKIVKDICIVIDGQKNNLQDRDFENVYNLPIHHSYFSK